jgi:uncharacterized protein (TIGR00730 family)
VGARGQPVDKIFTFTWYEKDYSFLRFQLRNELNELCDGVIALPGGFGTLEEFFEMLTWGQLGLHQKPVALLNIDHFYDALITLLQTMVEKGFLKEINQKMLLVSHDIDDLLDQMENYIAPAVGKWIVSAAGS